MKKIDTIIFDWDGTLIDSIDWIVYCVRIAAEESLLPVPSKEAARNIIGLSLVGAMQELFPDVEPNQQQQMAQSYARHFLSKEISRADLFEGVYELLLSLKQAGYQLAVATGKTRKGLDRALHGTGIGDLFSITCCADETVSKPDPAMLIKIMRHLDTDNTRALMIGDTVHDLQMAENANMASVAVFCGAQTPELLQQFNPLYCLQHTKQLIEYL